MTGVVNEPLGCSVRRRPGADADRDEKGKGRRFGLEREWYENRC
jgi:hypothetical protein